MSNIIRSATTGGTHPRRPHPETIRGSSRCSRTRDALLGIERTQSADINSEFVGKIEGVLRDHGVIVFATPTAGVRFDSDAAA
jgi:hypothetical protein